MREKVYVYIMTNKANTVLYTGVTSNLLKRTYEHKACPGWSEGTRESFTEKYNVNKLVYYEVFDDVQNAISREKQIKAGSRKKKIDLIKSMNKDWEDLYGSLF
jgi:putative endonuclease